ncbi:helix-turn-helix domain-containing protein [Alkaliflexus imshenetskii]|uniref:helix-turn-helix domain-containing protein n=1 Tax=Alkaliflexus imshenetskii TaxID=286730 RepID=UPI00047E71B9|nr:AraC family transcriptional regulator [Alkaliflexus imshenetskii]
MASHRCVSMVEDELKKLQIEYRSVELGEVELLKNITDLQRHLLQGVLLQSGLELMNSSNDDLISEIKRVVQDWIDLSDIVPEETYSAYLKRKLNHDYSYLSQIFSVEEDTTLERYIITQRIERVKQLIADDKLSISDITYKMHYSSVPHLCNQFKKYTGITPVQFRHSVGQEKV